ncbi:3-hydroxybutyryl-CoA dehydrogenase [Amycolatopsis alkalitolerans]|nr:3-hydroxybutyryl-CoA dehydrogenase [Amycolatopsis alkalitolerans]
MNDIRHIGVIGCGVMGSGIAELCVRRQIEVVVVVRAAASAGAGRTKLTRSLDHAVRKNRIGEAQRDDALARVSFATDLDAVAKQDLVIESVTEDEAVKRILFSRLDQVVTNPDAILASNTSVIPIMKLARVTRRPEHVLGIHFFNPAPTLPLVELVETLVSDEKALARTERFLTDVLGKEIVRSHDRCGFIVNALLIPYLLSAIRMVESGFGSAVDIDRAMMLGCAYPIGPLALIDMIGLDTIADVSDAMQREYREPQYVAPPLLSRMVEAGMLGRKTGAGFHQYGK